MIGAPRDDDVGFDVGSAFVYFRTVDGCVFASTLLPSRESTAMEFGSQVVLGQDDIFVSALDTIFVNSRSRIGEAPILNEEARIETGGFVRAMVFDSNTLAVGLKPQVLLFERPADGWPMTGVLATEIRGRSQLFGQSLALAGDTLAVGETSSSNGIGVVQIFQRPSGAALKRRL